jgi:hypothetical protein
MESESNYSLIWHRSMKPCERKHLNPYTNCRTEEAWASWCWSCMPTLAHPMSRRKKPEWGSHSRRNRQRTKGRRTAAAVWVCRRRRPEDEEAAVAPLAEGGDGRHAGLARLRKSPRGDSSLGAPSPLGGRPVEPPGGLRQHRQDRPLPWPPL